MPVVYGFTCKETNMAYVGCTAGSLRKREREHSCLLRGKKHTAYRMQQDWDKFGAKSFVMVELERLPDDASIITKRERELYWMKSLESQGKLYNAYLNSFKPTDEAIAKGQAAAVASNLKTRAPWAAEANAKRGKSVSLTKQHLRDERLAQAMGWTTK